MSLIPLEQYTLCYCFPSISVFLQFDSTSLDDTTVVTRRDCLEGKWYHVDDFLSWSLAADATRLTTACLVLTGAGSVAWNTTFSSPLIECIMHVQ